MEFIRKIRNSCERFTWTSQAAVDAFEEEVAHYLKKEEERPQFKEQQQVVVPVENKRNMILA